MNLAYILYLILSPIIYLILLFSIPFNPKIRDHWINQKKAFNKVKKRNYKKPIIIHAASAGEFEQVKPILRDYNKKNPIIQTFFSPTIYNKEKKSNLFNVCCYHPFDFPWSALIFFLSLKPKAYIINRHDVWPHFIIIAKLLKIKIFYINANLASDSLRLKYFKNFHSWLFKKIDMIITPSIEIQNRFEKNFNLSNIQTLQDTRYMQIINRIKINKKVLPNWLKESNNIILGSIDEKDWEILKDSLVNISEKNKVIIVPHEVDYTFINEIEKDLKELKLVSKRLNSINENENLNCLIYDKVGDLLDIYKYGKGAYVGCGFSGGVHNVLEPLLQGCFVSYGPIIELLDEAIKLNKYGLGKMIYNKNDFTNFIQKINDDNFLNKNKANVLKNFELNENDFNKMKEIIF